MSTARIKSDIERYAEALEAMGLGEYHQAERIRTLCKQAREVVGLEAAPAD